MRKLFLAGVSVLALGVSGAMAQTATTLQNGDDNDAFIRQSPVAGPNAANGDAFINQDGNLNAAAIRQQGDGASDADIDQIGDSNQAGIVQRDLIGSGTTADINQNGSGDQAGILQRNEGNGATINQAGTGAGSQAIIVQGNPVANGSPEFADLTETGPGGATADTSFLAGLATDLEDIQTTAEFIPDLLGAIPLNPAEGRSQNSVAEINQTGDDHRAGILQYGDVQDGTITQIGIGNDGLIFQENGIGAGSNFANLNQEGNDGTGIILQNGTDNDAAVDQFGNDDFAAVGQLGVNNTADVDQNGNLNFAVVGQFGSDNVAEVNQTNDGAVAFEAQIGNGNNALIVQ